MDLVPLKKSNLTRARLEQLCDAGARPTQEINSAPLARPWRTRTSPAPGRCSMPISSPTECTTFRAA